MNFAEAVKTQNRFTRTENGAVALSTTGHACLDLFATIGALRNTDDLRIQRLFADAYAEDPLVATKIVFYGRDIRENGLGERNTFRVIIRYMAEHHPEALRSNLHLIGEYGRYDDLYQLIGTPLENEMWNCMKDQFEEDMQNMNAGNPVSLLAKWIKTADASSRNTRKLGILTANKLGYPVYSFKRMVRALRRHIVITESFMSANKWDEIEYSKVPSRASLIYRNAFMRHDEDRYKSYIAGALIGTEKIHSDTLYPYDLVGKIWAYTRYHNLPRPSDCNTIEALWRQLPDYVDGSHNVLVIADTSGSMSGRPMHTAVGLAIYFAERNKGAYHNLWMNFSSQPSFQKIRGETLAQKISSINYNNWGQNTNLRAAFEKVLETAISNNVSGDDIPKAIVVISDMEIDNCGDEDWTFYDAMDHRFKECGYQIPNIVFWNVNSRHDTFHADSTRRGVQLVSGQSASTFKNVMQCIGMTPVEAMMKVINSSRYEPIKIGG